jgi:hypothetical protein
MEIVLRIKCKISLLMPFFSLSSLPLVFLMLSNQLYASTIPCDTSVNLTNLTNCNERSSSSSKPDSINDMRSDATQTPAILPDISPTEEDLNDPESDSNENDRGATTSTSTSTDSSDYDTNNADDGETNDQDANDKNDSGDGPTMIPFP